MWTTKNAQVVTSLLTSCNNLLQQANIRMTDPDFHLVVIVVTLSYSTMANNFYRHPIICATVTDTAHVVGALHLSPLKILTLKSSVEFFIREITIDLDLSRFLYLCVFTCVSP